MSNKVQKKNKIQTNNSDPVISFAITSSKVSKSPSKTLWDIFII